MESDTRAASANRASQPRDHGEAYTRRRKDQAASLLPEADGALVRIEQLTEPAPAAAERARPVTDTDDPDPRGS